MRMIPVLVLLMLSPPAAASADSRISLAIERDNLLPVVDRPESIVQSSSHDADRATIGPRPGRFDPWPAIDAAMLVASSVALAADWHSTRCFARRGWVTPDGWLFEERNPIMRGRPSERTVDLYFATSAAVNVLAWYLTPRRWRIALPLAVSAVSIDRAVHNAMLDHGRGDCGL
jgi:hypothetical protein